MRMGIVEPTSYTKLHRKQILKFSVVRVTRLADSVYLKISAKNRFISSHERLSAFSL